MALHRVSQFPVHSSALARIRWNARRQSPRILTRNGRSSQTIVSAALSIVVAVAHPSHERCPME